MSGQVRLSRGLFAVVDEADLPIVGQYNWYAHKTSHSGVLLHYARGRVGDARLMMHKLLTGWSRVDHVNGDGLDNRRANLRPSSRSENMHNRRKSHIYSSRFKGVYWLAPGQCWRAMIGVGGKRLHLGLFAAEDEAALAYDAAARTHYGQYAALNFPMPGEQGALSRGGPS